MKQVCFCLFFLFIAAAVTTARAQGHAAASQNQGPPWGSGFDSIYGDTGFYAGPTKLTGVVDKIEKFKNGIRITVKVHDKKEYQYNLFYARQGPQVTLSVARNLNVQLHTVDNLKLQDTVFLKLDDGKLKALVLKERPVEKPMQTQ